MFIFEGRTIIYKHVRYLGESGQICPCFFFFLLLFGLRESGKKKLLEKLGEKFPAEILLQFLYAALQETSSETDRKKDGERGKKRVEMSFCDSSGDADLTYSLL